MYYGRSNSITVKNGERVVKSYDSNSAESRGLVAAIQKAISIAPPFDAVVEANTLTVELFNEFDNRKLTDSQMEKIFDTLCEISDNEGKYYVQRIRYGETSFEIDYEVL